MDANVINELQNGLSAAYINGSVAANLAYKPAFVSNNPEEGKKVISSVEDELLRCDQFQISVAFITMGGVTPLLQTLKELEKKGVKGQILTTNYLNFSEPRALEKLNGLKNITLKMYDVEAAGKGFHTKGYIFKKEEIYRIIIGSSNMTSAALTVNKEWNTKLISTENGDVAEEIIKEFNNLWNSEYALPYNDFYEIYKERYNIIKHQREIAKSEEIPSLEKYRLKPNSMQERFIVNLRKILEQGEERALLISATGTGKTYASAFAMREMGFQRVLFLVHRNQIAKQAIKSYRKVFGGSVSMGMVTGKYQEYDKDYIFATIQTLSKEETLQRYSRQRFDAIVIDEAHHSAANSYKKVLDYFQPKLWLGMTATPDKRDDNLEGRNIYEIFNHQIAYEIRLQDAMEEDLLCPFHYFGITDLDLIADGGKSSEERIENFRHLTSDERVENVMKQARYFGYSGERVKGLIFCSRIDEAKELSAKFNKNGWRTLVLSGNDSEEARAAAIERLAGKESENALDYIISVDIFSEGVDVPEINQVIMLRPTQSPIVFIQQLGRGLRKAEDKEYVVVLDFIGNYQNNFMIPIALSGDRSYNKDNIRRYVTEGGRIIPGASTIHFDEISRKKIYESIDGLRTTKKMLSAKYFEVKDRLGKIPSIVDFYTQGEVDPLLLIQYAGNYYHFLKMIDKEYSGEMTDREEACLEFVSQNLANGKRIYELIMLQQLLQEGRFNKKQMEIKLRQDYNMEMSEKSFESAVHVLEGEFINTQSERKKYSQLDILTEEKDQFISRTFLYYVRIRGSEFIRQMKDIVELGIRRYSEVYQKEMDDLGLSLYQKYSRKDICRLLNWEKDESSTVYGYKIKYDTCPIFVTYHKKEDIAKSTMYEDAFVNNQIFSWMTRSRVSLDSVESQKLIHAEESGLKVLLFIKKSDGEGTDFYYMGQVMPAAWEQTRIQDDKGRFLPIMNFQLQMSHPVREDIYQYFVNE